MPLTKNSGQTAIFVFVLLVVGLAITLSLGNRTLLDLQSSGTSDFSSRAFSAAEAGAEQALKGSLNTLTTSGTTQYTSPVATFSSSGQSLANFTYIVTPVTTVALRISQDNVLQVPLKTGNNSYYSGAVKLLWVNIKDNLSGTFGENVSGSRPSIEITLLKPQSGDFYAYKGVFNADSVVNSNASGGNYFVNPSTSSVAYTLPGTSVSATLSVPNYNGGIGDTDANGNLTRFNQAYANLLTISIPNSEHYAYLRIRAIYNSVSVAVETGNQTNRDLPAQSFIINSYGTAGNAKRSVQVTKSSPGLPPIFDFVLFNGSSASFGK